MPSLASAIRLLGLLLAGAAGSAQEPAALSLESLFHPVRKVAYVAPLPVTLHWRADGTLLEEWQERDASRGLARLGPPDWEPRPLLNRTQFVAALAGAGLDERAAVRAWDQPFVWNADRDAFLASVGEDFYLVNLAGAPGGLSARRVTAAPGPKEGAVFSPDGSQVAYLRGADLYVTDLASARATRLTVGGDEDHLNGRLDWLYQEEVFAGEGPGAFWWAPDSRHIAFLSLDESQVPKYTLMDEVSRPRRALSVPYPQAGENNPAAHLGVADLEGRVTWVEDPFPALDTLIVQVGWDPQGRLVASYQDRTQTWLECLRLDTKPVTLVREEAHEGWIERQPLPVFLADGFLWRSARAGFQHLYRYDGEGRVRGALTAGPWDVRAIQGVDEKAGRVYFSATQRNPIGLDAYAVDLNGSAPNQNLARLTARPGTHSVVYNSTFSAGLDRFSDLDTPPQLLLLRDEGRALVLAESPTHPALRTLTRGRVSFQQVPTRDGVPMETMLVLPPGFDPNKRYPVFQFVYGGPGHPAVRNAFSSDLLWYQFLAQQGIVTWICDNRSASGKGSSAQGIYRQVGVQELRDQLDGLAWLKARGWADMNRIALCGFSYGGFFTAYAMSHSKAWKLGIMGAPVVDWRLYDSIFTERHMGLPADNPDGYAASAPLGSAALVSGPVLLIHGTLDRNVHPENSFRFLDALQKAGHGAPLILLPGADHRGRAARHLWTLYQSLWDFLQRKL